MKKLLSSLIILTMIVCAFSTVTFAADADFTVDGNVVSGKTIAQVIQGQSSKSGVTSTIVVNKDLEIPAHNTGMSVPANYDIVLDLGGHTLSTDRAFLVNGTLTIKNGVLNCSKNCGAYSISMNANGRLILDDVTINSEGASGAIDIQNDDHNAQIVIYGGTVINAAYNIIFANDSTSKTTIYGGTFTSNASDGRILKLANQSSAMIYGGTFKNAVKGTSATYSTAFNGAGATCKVYGGTFYFNPTNASWINRDNYQIVNSAGVYTVLPKAECFSVWGNGEALTFADAVNFVENGGTITLNNNVEVTKRLVVSGVNKTFTIDLNGKTLKTNYTVVQGNSGQVFEFKDNSDITLVNGKIVSDVITTEGGKNPNMIMVGTTWGDKETTGKLTLGGDGNALLIKGGASTNLLSQIAYRSTLVVNDGVEFEVIDGANTTNCIYTLGDITINGGEFKNNGNGDLSSRFINSIKICGTTYEKTAIINDGTFYNNIEIERAKKLIAINGGTYYGKLFNDVDFVPYNISFNDYLPSGKYANEYDGYVKVETTSNKESVTAAIANASYDDGKGENTVTKRFFKMVNSLDYAVVGFEIKAGEYTWDIPLTSVYSKVLVNGKVYNAGENEYVLTGAIGDVPVSYDGEFEVSAYAINFEGNKVPLN